MHGTDCRIVMHVLSAMFNCDSCEQSPMALSRPEPRPRPDDYCRLDVTLRLERQFGNIVLIVERNGSAHDYKRFDGDTCVVTKTIASARGLKMGILPLAPVNVPARYGSNMMLKFENPLVMQSHSRLEGYFKMPYEIGAVSFDTGESRIIDTFCLGLPKYGLYGNPENGIICRSYKTKLSSEVPAPKIHQEAIGRLRIHNDTGSTQSLNKVVFQVEGVDFYFSQNRVFFKDVEATIKNVASKTVIETGLADARWSHDTTGLAQNPVSHYTMEWGF